MPGIFIAALICTILGAAVGAAAMRRHLTTATPEAKERANHRDAVALARDLLKTPDALDLRDRAATVIAEYERVTANREDS